MLVTAGTVFLHHVKRMEWNPKSLPMSLSKKEKQTNKQTKSES